MPPMQHATINLRALWQSFLNERTSRSPRVYCQQLVFFISLGLLFFRNVIS